MTNRVNSETSSIRYDRLIFQFCYIIGLVPYGAVRDFKAGIETLAVWTCTCSFGKPHAHTSYGPYMSYGKCTSNNLQAVKSEISQSGISPQSCRDLVERMETSPCKLQTFSPAYRLYFNKLRVCNGRAKLGSICLCKNCYKTVRLFESEIIRKHFCVHFY